MATQTEVQDSPQERTTAPRNVSASRFIHAPLPFDPVLIGAGLQVATRSLARWAFGWKRYPGSVEAICRAVLEDCWRGEFFGGSAGHFGQFWTRDLAMCTGSLCRLGHRQRVLDSWTWALAKFESAGRISTTIFARRFPRDVYAFACDSLPLLLFGVEQSGADSLLHKHKSFLAREVERYCERVYDPELGLARADRYFSSARDCIAARSPVFANTMLALLERILGEMPFLPNPLRGHNIAARIRENYWSSDFFRDSLDNDLPSGDANTWPFFLRIFTDPEMQRRALDTLESRGFTQPVPLRYFADRLAARELRFPRLFAPNYQGDTSWTQIGPIYLHLLRTTNLERMERQRNAMAEFIARDQNYLELYTKEGRPYRGRAGFYFADEGMLWASLFLDLF